MDTLRLAYGHCHWVEPGEPAYDALLVNGEGTMHHSNRGWFKKMRRLGAAIAHGKPAYLINSLWQDNGPEFDDTLRRLDGIAVREVLSARDLQERHGVVAPVQPDLSFYAPLDHAAEGPDWRGETVVTDFYLPDEGRWGRAPTLGHLPQADMAALSWSALVKGFRSAALVITGRHHAVYAACVAEVPFIATSTNSHKIEGLMASAGVRIRVLRDPPSLEEAYAMAEAQALEYLKLFDWLKRQPLALPVLGR